ncbi:hypothetical protein A0J61_07968 [Choanephora cucurbitarum]|uniref:EamA domain-containing protein n=1 Tax=Choanephora cucurbitarum TaxID=101091 RepID=A0A1C7N4J5_9FUNG|nr:hypothetical protein A0J61_07968 [Choanephora cucurbitarum]
MASYHTLPTDEQPPRSPTIQYRHKQSRSVLATAMLTICIITFVLQTELAQYVQKTTQYSKPYFILYISHSCYVFMIPIQILAEYTQLPHKTLSTALHDLIQYRVQGNHTDPMQFVIKTSLWLSVLLTLPAYIWYLSVNLTSMSSLTAIYNTGCFFAYLFSILMLKDKLRLTKICAVLLCLIGVLTMACWPLPSEDSDIKQAQKDKIAEWMGILVASIGAALYGFYEVYYKKYASPSQPTVLFANTLTGTIGLITLLVLWIPFPILHMLNIETFELPDLETFGYILAIASMSVIYNATFMAVIALVNPVFAAVGVMLTIPAVAVTDVLITGVMVPLPTIFGSLFILVGFVILNKQVGIEEKIDQEMSIEG